MTLPPPLDTLPALLDDLALPLAPEVAWLLAQPLHFFYIRGPHLSPPHQISGASPSQVTDLVRHLGLTTIPQPHPPTGLVPEDRRLGHVGGAWFALLAPAPVVSGSPAPDGAWHRLAPPPVRRDWRTALGDALAAMAYTMMICPGAPQGIDGIEFASEDIARWPLVAGWPESAAAAAAEIRQHEGLGRRRFAAALRTAAPLAPEVAAWPAAWEEIADRWDEVAAGLAAAATGNEARLAPLGRQFLRLAGAESRAWGLVIDAFGKGI